MLCESKQLSLLSYCLKIRIVWKMIGVKTEDTKEAEAPGLSPTYQSISSKT